jgi:hypothetical protein
VEGLSWDKIALQYGYKNGVSARKTLQGMHPALWREAFEQARSLYLDEIESEALLTQRDLIRPHKENKDGSKIERDERIRQSAAHSLLVHSARMRAQKLEISGPQGDPLTIAQCQADKDWMKKRKALKAFYDALPKDQQEVLRDALRRINTGNSA